MTAKEILEEVCALQGLSPAAVLAKGRGRQSRPVCKARHAAMARLRQELGWSFGRIAIFFDVDHSTVFYAVKKILKVDPAGARAINHNDAIKQQARMIALQARTIQQQARIIENLSDRFETMRRLPGMATRSCNEQQNSALIGARSENAPAT